MTWRKVVSKDFQFFDIDTELVLNRAKWRKRSHIVDSNEFDVKA